jgi:spore germination protein YaaH
LDLSQAAVRQTILVTAQRLLDLGFDGIHFDVEPVCTGDPHYVSLLRDSQRLTRTQGKTTSVATFKALRPPIATIATSLLSWPVGLWDTAYFQEVAQQVDQVAVMMYDTGLPYDFLYGAATARQIRYLSGLVGDQKPFFIGVPTYDDQRLTFHAEAENMASGLRGVRRALEGLGPSATRNLGVAVYADWTTDPAEWETYRRLWLLPD